MLITIGVVLAGLSLVAGVLVGVWLAGNYSIDRLLAILGASTSTIGVTVIRIRPLTEGCFASRLVPSNVNSYDWSYIRSNGLLVEMGITQQPKRSITLTWE